MDFKKSSSSYSFQGKMNIHNLGQLIYPSIPAVLSLIVAVFYVRVMSYTDKSLDSYSLSYTTIKTHHLDSESTCSPNFPFSI